MADWKNMENLGCFQTILIILGAIIVIALVWTFAMESLETVLPYLQWVIYAAIIVWFIYSYRKNKNNDE